MANSFLSSDRFIFQETCPSTKEGSKVNPHSFSLTFRGRGESEHRGLQSNLFIVEVRVAKGRAPVYFQQNGNAYVRFSGSTRQMDSTTVHARMNHSQPFDYGLVTALPKDFIGREEELAKIREYMSIESICHLVFLWGLPVVGKSTLARRLVSEFKSTLPDRQYIINM